MLDVSQLPENALQAITGDELHRSTELFSVVKQLRLRLTNITEETLDRSYTQHVQVNTHTHTHTRPCTINDYAHNKNCRCTIDLCAHINSPLLALTSLLSTFLYHTTQNVFSQLEKKLTEIESPSSRQAEIIMARHGLCDASMQQIILLCESISPALGGVLSQVSRVEQRLTEMSGDE